MTNQDKNPGVESEKEESKVFGTSSSKKVSVAPSPTSENSTLDRIREKVFTGEYCGHIFEETKEAKSDWTLIKCVNCRTTLSAYKKGD